MRSCTDAQSRQVRVRSLYIPTVQLHGQCISVLGTSWPSGQTPAASSRVTLQTKNMVTKTWTYGADFLWFSRLISHPEPTLRTLMVRPLGGRVMGSFKLAACVGQLSTGRPSWPRAPQRTAHCCCQRAATNRPPLGADRTSCCCCCFESV